MKPRGFGDTTTTMTTCATRLVGVITLQIFIYLLCAQNKEVLPQLQQRKKNKTAEKQKYPVKDAQGRTSLFTIEALTNKVYMTGSSTPELTDTCLSVPLYPTFFISKIILS